MSLLLSLNQEFRLKWKDYQRTLVQVFSNLLNSEALVDCTLAAEGQYLRAHKVVLCACSPYLDTLLRQHYEKHPIVILPKDVKFQELKLMVDYMYKGEISVSQDELDHFLKAAESLQIKGLLFDEGNVEGDESVLDIKSIPSNQPESPVVLPSQVLDSLSKSQPGNLLRSREGSTSPTPRKRRRHSRSSQGEEEGHVDNASDLPRKSQSISIPSVPISTPALPSSSSSTITKAPPLNEYFKNPEYNDLLKQNIESPSKMFNNASSQQMASTGNSLDDNPAENNGRRHSQDYPRKLAHNTETSEFRCVYCHRIFTINAKRRKHAREVHGVYECDHCDFQTKQKEQFYTHIFTIHRHLYA